MLENQNEVIQEKKKSGSPRHRPDEIKLSIGLRIFPSDREIIEKRFKSMNGSSKGSVQAFFDKYLAEELSKDYPQD